jgi:hypothetical protein
MGRGIWRGVGAGLFVLGALLSAERLEAQEIRGRVVDSENGAAVGLAAIFLLDRDRNPVAAWAADVDGNYILTAPEGGEYIMIVERLGYFESESPLLAVEEGGVYGVDFEMRPEPFRLDPLEVTVQNEKLEDFLTLEFGRHPASLAGYRSIQGARLEEAKLMSDDNTETLRNLYIPVSHGARVCVGSLGAPGHPARSAWERQNEAVEAATAGPSEAPTRTGQCGALFVDGYQCLNEQFESINMDRIGVVVTFTNAVHLYTRDFDWTFRPGGGAPGC